MVGLGNPGRKYQNTRHNVGFLVIEELKRRHIDPSNAIGAIDNKRRDKKRNKAKKPLRGQIQIVECIIAGKAVVLGRPHTFMNLSGKAVRLLTRKYRITDYSKLIIIHDELDLPPGKVKSKYGGGMAGHKGLNSIRTELRSKDFWRIRVGIGKPPSSEEGADFVLSPITEAETREGILLAADVVEELLQT